MLKGHVFSKQLFGNPIFALFINTFLNGKDGVSSNYKNGMTLSHTANEITIQSGAICIQGRFIEEDTYTTISVGADNACCKLILEIDLDKENTETELNQVSYKIIKGANTFPNLTQMDIVKNNSGIYQYELARFKTGSNGISNFQDMRTFLDFDSIYQEIRNEYRDVLAQLESELDQVEDESIYLLKAGGNANGDFNFAGNVICDKFSNSKRK